MKETLLNYQKLGLNIGAYPGTPEYHPVQDIIYQNIACPFPITISNALQDPCSQYSTQSLSFNPSAAQWCGCYLNGEEYLPYSAKYNIQPECTPMCNRQNTIPIIKNNGDIVTCEKSICLIDGVTVNLTNSSVGGSIDFNNVCGNCNGSNCSCIITDTNIDINNGTIGGNVVPFSQGCGNYICGSTNNGNIGPNVINGQCSGIDGGNGNDGMNSFVQWNLEHSLEKNKSQVNSNFWTFVLIGVGLILIFVLSVFMRRNGR